MSYGKEMSFETVYILLIFVKNVKGCVVLSLNNSSIRSMQGMLYMTLKNKSEKVQARK